MVNMETSNMAKDNVFVISIFILCFIVYNLNQLTTMSKLEMIIIKFLNMQKKTIKNILRYIDKFGSGKLVNPHWTEDNESIPQAQATLVPFIFRHIIQNYNVHT